MFRRVTFHVLVKCLYGLKKSLFSPARPWCANTHLSPGVVIASLKGSMYRSVWLASSLSAALLDGLFEHPEALVTSARYGRIHRPVVFTPSFSAACYVSRLVRRLYRHETPRPGGFVLLGATEFSGVLFELKLSHQPCARMMHDGSSRNGEVRARSARSEIRVTYEPCLCSHAFLARLVESRIGDCSRRAHETCGLGAATPLQIWANGRNSLNL